MCYASDQLSVICRVMKMFLECMPGYRVATSQVHKVSILIRCIFIFLWHSQKNTNIRVAVFSESRKFQQPPTPMLPGPELRNA